MGRGSGGGSGGSGPKQKTRNCKPHYQRPYLFMRLEAGGVEVGGMEGWWGVACIVATHTSSLQSGSTGQTIRV